MGAFDKSAIDKDTRQYATRIRRGEVGHYVLLPGDPARVDRIGNHLDDVTLVADSREFRTITGSYKGITVSATSTGLIRVGSTAGLQPRIRTGDIVINTGVVRNDGTTRAYVPDTYPAIADHFLVHALIETARSLRTDAGFDVYIGLGACDDAFYAVTPEWIERHSRLGLLNIEMESSAIFTVAQLRGVHAAMVCGVSGNLVVADFGYDVGEHGNQRLVEAWENAIAIALEAIIRYDAEWPAPPAA